MLIAFNKPFGVACKFSPEPGRKTLADYIDVRDVYPAGRLDTDSEGLMLLTDDGVLQARIAEPKHKMAKVYWAQVEGSPSRYGTRSAAQRRESRRFHDAAGERDSDRGTAGTVAARSADPLSRENSHRMDRAHHT